MEEGVQEVVDAIISSMMLLHHYSIHTERTYIDWRYIPGTQYFIEKKEYLLRVVYEVTDESYVTITAYLLHK